MADIVERLRGLVATCGCGACEDAANEIERLRAELRTVLCPGGGYAGQPKDEEPTVGACLKAGVCGCRHGDALKVGKP